MSRQRWNRFSRRGGRFDLGLRRYLVWNIVDKEPWRDQTCAGCGKPFTEDPRFSCTGGYPSAIHMECEFAGLHKHFPDDPEPDFEPTDYAELLEAPR